MVTEKKEDIADVIELVEVENDYILRFGKPYVFEDEVYEEVDLSGIENLTASDMIAAQRVMSKGGAIEALPEMTMQYACVIAARVTKKPMEFFTMMPAKDAIRLKNIVTGFIFGAD